MDRYGILIWTPNPVVAYNSTLYGNNEGFVQKLSQCASYTTQNIDACNDFTWLLNDSTYNSTATDFFSLTNANGCDSVVKLDLTIHDIDLNINLTGITLTTVDTNAIGYQWIDCNTGQPIPGATSQSLIPVVNGEYAVVIFTNDCSDTTDCYSLTTIGLDETSTGRLVFVYPNPTHGPDKY